MELGHHALRQLPDLASAFDCGSVQETLRLRAIKSRMHAGDVIEQLRDPYPARQDRDIGNERDIAHELFACAPGITAKNS